MQNVKRNVHTNICTTKKDYFLNFLVFFLAWKRKEKIILFIFLPQLKVRQYRNVQMQNKLSPPSPFSLLPFQLLAFLFSLVTFLFLIPFHFGFIYKFAKLICKKASENVEKNLREDTGKEVHPLLLVVRPLIIFNNFYSFAFPSYNLPLK